MKIKEPAPAPAPAAVPEPHSHGALSLPSRFAYYVFLRPPALDDNPLGLPSYMIKAVGFIVISSFLTLMSQVGWGIPHFQ